MLLLGEGGGVIARVEFSHQNSDPSNSFSFVPWKTRSLKGEEAKEYLANCQLSVVKISVSAWADCDFFLAQFFAGNRSEAEKRLASLMAALDYLFFLIKRNENWITGTAAGNLPSQRSSIAGHRSDRYRTFEF